MTDELLTADRLRAALAVTERWLATNRDAINAINVYPVPDGDTGTNMLLTLRAGLAAADTTPGATETVGTLCDRIAQGALLGARGNSGVILSQMMRGAAEALVDLEAASPTELVRALQNASDVAYEAVSTPVEGTMLTVLREAAEATVAVGPDTLVGVFTTAEAAAQTALDRTPQQLARLREAGVVDSGGLGIVVLLAGLRMGLTGEEVPSEPILTMGAPDIAAMEHTGYGYCTEFVVQAPRLDRQSLSQRLNDLGGESILVVGDLSTLHVHVHMRDPGPALSAGATVGSLSAVKVDNMQSQHEDWAARASEPPPMVLPGLGLVAVARGAGFEAAFRGLGAIVAIPPDDARPSAGELIEAARRTGRANVLLLPNDSDVLMAAEQAAQQSEGLITVLPSRSMSAGLSAALAFNADDTPMQAHAAMRAALDGVRCVEVTRAARDARVDDLTVEVGQAIALLDGHVVATGASLDDALIAGVTIAVTRAPTEIVTVYLGSNAPIGAEEMVMDRLGAALPGLTVEVMDGGQPHYPYIVGVE